MGESKPAIKSIGVIGNSTALVAVITGIVAASLKLPPEAVSPVVAPLVVGALGIVTGLIGRIRAQGPIKGIINSVPLSDSAHDVP